MRILILEDDLKRHRAFMQNLTVEDVFVEIVTSTKECKELLEKSHWDVLFLDHDLDGKQMVPSGPGTGWEVADWLSKHIEFRPNTIILHTFNPEGAENMMNILGNSAKFKTIYLPGAWDYSWHELFKTRPISNNDNWR